MSVFSSASALIIAALQAKLLPETIRIYPADDLDYVIKNAMSPAISVIFFDDVAVEGSVNNFRHLGKQEQASNQYWLVIISVRNVQDVGNTALQQIGDVVDTVLTTLQGHVLSEVHTPLNRVKSPYRKTTKNGFTHLPFMFSTKIVM